ncbi:MAG: DinB family protein [Anaerolineaceae bacterium]|nr:DinB family protein [Anaerolineaceae bacterium]
MSITLLIDLDDTLLINPLESFMPAYIKLLSKKLTPHVAPEKMVPQLLAATDCMIKNPFSAKTLEQTFDENFYPVLGIEKSDVAPLIIDFYQNEFNELKKVTNLRPEAVKLIKYATDNNYNIVVATNPLFPQTAMRSRLNWAGFTDDNFPFRFVTSYEMMHFSKPNPAYYAEILGRLGWPRGPICMVGNSLKEDILPSSLLGIPGFWVDGNIEKLKDARKMHIPFGGLNEVIPWLESLPDPDGQIDLQDVQGILGTLRATPVVMQYLTEELSETDWKKKSDTQSLSVLEMLSHLMDVETEINAPRIELVLSGENPFIAGVDSDPWIVERQYQNTRSPQVLSDFEAQRQNSIVKLAALSHDEWMLPARHSFFGPTTLLELVRFIALHDIDHIRQVYALINAEFKDKSDRL